MYLLETRQNYALSSITVQYRHLIPASVNRTYVSAWLYKHPYITCLKIGQTYQCPTYLANKKNFSRGVRKIRLHIIWINPITDDILNSENAFFYLLCERENEKYYFHNLLGGEYDGPNVKEQIKNVLFSPPYIYSFEIF